MHDGVGPRGEHGLAHGGGVERVEDDRLGPHGPDVLRAVAGGPGDVVAALDELGDEAAAQSAGRAGDEDA